MRATLTLIAILLAVPAAAQSLRFEDVTVSAGMTLDGKGHGVAVHDYDKDGWPDLFVAASTGSGALFRNRGDGTFEDVTEQAGLSLGGGYAAPGWADIDNDGWSDLVIVGPNGPNKVFRALGDGTFEDISVMSGISPDAKAASLAFGDYDQDGLVDLFLAIDHGPDILYQNRGNGQFQNTTAQAGMTGPTQAVAMQATWFDYDHNGSQDLFVVHDGVTKSRLHRNLGYLPLIDQAATTAFDNVGSGNSMGIAIGDVDGDGWEDVYVTRIGEAGLYRNLQGQGFEMMTDALGAWRNGMSWGTVFTDFDNDLDPDLFVVSTSGFDGTKTLLYENRNSWFYDQSVSAGASFYVEAQGLTTLDYDLDGRMDLVFPTHDGSIRLLKGVTENPGNWLKITLTGTDSNRDAIGARIVVQVGDKTLSGFVSGGDSFCSQSGGTVHFGLGDASTADRVTVYWGGSAEDSFTEIPAGHVFAITQGTGTAAPVATESAPEVPNESIQAFPNPFLADTRIRVMLPEAQIVRVVVTDLLGRTVSVLADGILPAGPTDLAFAANSLPTGTYLIRMETKSGVSASAVTRIR